MVADRAETDENHVPQGSVGLDLARQLGAVDLGHVHVENGKAICVAGAHRVAHHLDRLAGAAGDAGAQKRNQLSNCVS